MTFPRKIEVDLPPWAVERWQETPTLNGDEERMHFVLELAKQNVEEGGGPFGATVVDEGSGAILGIGINRVVASGLSLAHAEMVALGLAQRFAGTPRLGQGRYALVTSAQPCSMCFGALPWSGINRLVVGAAREDVESLAGFDEGPVPADWLEILSRRNISVTRDVLRSPACEILRRYREVAGVIY